MTAHVLSLSGRTVNQKDAEAGAAKFAMCAACHGADGKGSVAHNLPFGAPNLTDNIWLYGGSKRAVEETLRNGRAGVMPAWKDILGEDKVHLLTAYVYSLSQDK
jgi:cytochrome c oxidase cbb3-type subunit 3